jgi:hypothetical protein
VGPRVGLDAVEKINLVLQGIEPRNRGRPDRRPSLYRLSYPDFLINDNIQKYIRGLKVNEYIG